MSKNTKAQIELMKTQGFHFDFGEIFEQTLQNFKKIALIQGLVLLVILVLFTVLIGSVAAAAIGFGEITQYFTDINVNGQSTVSLIVQLIVSVIGAGITTAFTAGLLKMAHLAEEGKEFGFGTAFDYYKSEFFKDLFLVGIYITLLTSGVGTLAGILMESFGEFKIGFVIFSSIFQVIAGTLTVFAIPLVIFGKLNAADAISGSISIATSKFWLILVLLLVFIIMVCLGIFGFCIGIFFTMPLLYSLYYIMYRNAFGVEDENEIDQIGIEKY